MPKSNKNTVARRTSEVVRLLLAGAEFAEIRQYASAQGWNVGSRQVRRYLEAAYKRLAKSTKRDRQQLMGRHLMQRRALYARSLRENDVRTALQVLRDEAQLEGLYPPTKIAPTTPDGQQPYSGATSSPLTRRERIVKLLAAQANNDVDQRRLIEQVTPTRTYRIPDTMLPVQMLGIMAQSYATEQLESLAMVCNALFCQCIHGDPDDAWEVLGQVHAYLFRAKREGWQLFCQKVGVDGSYLLREVYVGTMLDRYGDKICEIAPSAEEFLELAAKFGHDTPEKLVTSESIAKDLGRQFSRVCGE